MKFINDINMRDKQVLMRLDLNVPIKDGKVQDDTRIRAAVPSCQAVLKQGASHLILMSHLGRPKTAADSQFSLAPIAEYLENLLATTVSFMPELPSKADIKQSRHKVILLENTRFWPGETQNDEDLAKQLASLCDVFVMDAFASAHRAHASTHGVAQQVSDKCAGPLIQQELAALDRALRHPARPLVVIIGGAKVGDKLPLLQQLVKMADSLIVGGGIANTFLAATGKPIGDSLYEPDLMEMANELMRYIHIPLPQDVAVAKTLDVTTREEKLVEQIEPDDKILDIGRQTIGDYNQLIRVAKTIIWNGPVGVFEHRTFAKGTAALAKTIANSAAFSLAGGGDTISAINRFIDPKRINYISTGGGAFLEYIEKGQLPGLAVLTE